MIYYSNKNKDNIKKYITNIEQNNKNFSIIHYMSENKLQISLKCSNNNLDEVFDYTNFYSYHQLQIINKYFRHFDNTEQICHNLDKLLKKNKVSIEEKIGFSILSIAVSYKEESTNIIFKLLQNKISDFSGMNKKSKDPYHYKTEISKNSISMPKYNANETRNLRLCIDDLNDRVSLLESNRHNLESVSRGSMNRNNSNNANYNDRELLNNINQILTKMNKLEKENQEKGNRIKELEDKVFKFEKNFNNAINSPVNSDDNKSPIISKNEINNINEIKKKNNHSEEVEVEFNYENENSINKKKYNENKLKNKKEKKSPKYKFKQIESKDENKSDKKKELNESYNDESSKKLKKTKLKNKNESKGKQSNTSSLNNKEEEEKNNSNDNLKNVNHDDNSSHNKNENSEEENQKKEKNKKNKDEEEKVSEFEDDKNKKESDKSSENEKRKNSNSQEEKNNNHKKDKSLNKKSKIGDNGLPMVEREDIKKYINSRIFFTKEELQMVKNKVIKNRNHLHAYFDLLYRASLDGDYESKIIFCCEGIYPQIILFYTEEGARFGVYIEKEKHTNFIGIVKYKEIPGTSFLFSLNCLKTYDIIEGKKATDDSELKLCFGKSFYYNENESNWFISTPKNDFLNIECKLGDKENSFGLIDNSKIIGNQKEYLLKEVEIFKVNVYSNDNDEEDNDNKKNKKK